VLAALAVSGLPVDRFCFEGFLPRRAGERARRLAVLRDEPRTMVLFEAPHRTEATLRAMAETLGADRPAAVCRELTKTHEEVVRGTLAQLAGWAGEGVRGEVTLVVGGAPDDRGSLDAHALSDRVRTRVAEGQTRKDAIAAVAKETGVARRVVYDAAHDRRVSETTPPRGPG
jgi:16S rRNA (cytidine1402-2'-O)-methyltransferase